MREREPLLAATAMIAFARSRWGMRFTDRSALLRYQGRRLESFRRRTLPRAPYYRRWAGRPLASLPVVDKATVLADFAAFNTRGVTLASALSHAREAEGRGDVRTTLDGVTVGLSSGTSGTRGVFLVGPTERARWAGAALARLLSRDLLRQLLDPRRPPLRAALFLRSNSGLYETLASRRLDFAFHDLACPAAVWRERLNARPPDLLAAPPTVLRHLAEEAASGALHIAPRQIFSVAEVLEPDDERAIHAAFAVPVRQIYQCTEGFLGASCEAGRVHLNEDLVHIEPEWLDAEHRRFQPIVTDFSRTTQLIVRYRLDDVLRLADEPCACGRPSLALEAIEGRADDILWSPAPLAPPPLPALPESIGPSGAAPPAPPRLLPVFPDVLRRAFALADPEGLLRDYRLEQHGEEWRIRLAARPGAEDGAACSVRRELEMLARRLGLPPPALRFEPWREEPPSVKRRRIRCLRRPGELPGGPR